MIPVEVASKLKLPSGFIYFPFSSFRKLAFFGASGK
jgi:hypothetical protein